MSSYETSAGAIDQSKTGGLPMASSFAPGSLPGPGSNLGPGGSPVRSPEKPARRALPAAMAVP